VGDQRGARAASRRGTDAPRAPGVLLVSPYHLGVEASAAVGRPRLHLRHQPSVRLASDCGDASEQTGWAQPLVQIRAPGRRLQCSPAEDIAGAGLPIWILKIHGRAQLTVTAQLTGAALRRHSLVGFLALCPSFPCSHDHYIWFGVDIISSRRTSRRNIITAEHHVVKFVSTVSTVASCPESLIRDHRNQFLCGTRPIADCLLTHNSLTILRDPNRLLCRPWASQCAGRVRNNGKARMARSFMKDASPGAGGGQPRLSAVSWRGCFPSRNLTPRASLASRSLR
jgi:hypothetical protein